MPKLSHFTLIFLSGLVWLLGGCFLLPLGLNFIVEALLNENLTQPHPILNFIAYYVGGLEQAAIVWIAFALLVGFLKGGFVFSKSVQKSVKRILMLPDPSSISKIYSLSYYILLGVMVLFGFLVRFTTQDLRGGIDITIGFALIYGAMNYFREAWMVRRRQRSTI